MSFIKTFHRKPYPTISPSRPELSQAGQTVIITGGAQGIGFSISKAFAQAGAATIVIASRNLATIDSAIKTIKQDVPDFAGRIIAKECDLGDAASIQKLWESFDKEGILIDVLVLNAAKSGLKGPLVDIKLDSIWDEFSTNIRGNLDFAQRYFKQIRATPNGHRKVCQGQSTTVPTLT
jgi:NAD(P)-dependent dehydrogenase (short-subunit alcohol dehydrogenase family)